MDNYTDCWYQSSDGLRLYDRDYHCRELDKRGPDTVLCMHGLARIKSYVGRSAPVSNWDETVAQSRLISESSSLVAIDTFLADLP